MQGLKPTSLRRLFGTTEVVPCYKASRFGIHQTLPSPGAPALHPQTSRIQPIGNRVNPGCAVRTSFPANLSNMYHGGRFVSSAFFSVRFFRHVTFCNLLIEPNHAHHSHLGARERASTICATSTCAFRATR